MTSGFAAGAFVRALRCTSVTSTFTWDAPSVNLAPGQNSGAAKPEAIFAQFLSVFPAGCHIRALLTVVAMLAASSFDCLAGGSSASAPKPSTTAALEVLRKNCFGCHNPEKHKGGLDLSTRELLLKGGEGGPAVEVGRSSSSLLMKLLDANAEPHMPPKGQLSKQDVKVLKKWIDGGAPWVEGAMSGDAAPLSPVSLAALPSSYQPSLALALTSDGGLLAAGRGNSVLLYRVTSTNAVAVASNQPHPDAVQSLAFSPDGRVLASGAFRRLILWDVGVTNGLVKRLEVPGRFGDRLTALAFTPDGTQLIVAEGMLGARGRLRTVEVKSGAITRTWDAHNDLIYDMSVSTNGQLLATASADKLLKIWNLGTGKESARLEGHSLAVYGVALNHDGTQVASAGADRQLRVWDVQTREKIVNLGDPRLPMVAARWAQDTNLVVAASEGGAVLSYADFKQHSGEQSSSSGTERTVGQAGEGTEAIAISRDAGVVCASNSDGVIWVWKRDGKLIAKLTP